MTDIAFTLPTERPQERLSRRRALMTSLQAALTYGAFCVSIAFSFALVIGVVD